MDGVKNYFIELFCKYKTAIYSSFIMTFLTHLFFFSNRFINEDDLGFIHFGGNVLSTGRWVAGDLLMGISQIPIVRLVFVILAMVLITVLICDLFQIKSKKSMFLVALLLSTFPSLAVSFSYLFMIEIYIVALLLAVVAVYVTVRMKFGFILGSILISISLGCYQSYIGVAAALCLLYLIKMVLDKKDTKEIVLMVGKLLAMGIVGIILYFIILKIILSIKGVTLSNYKGANEMGIPPLGQWPSLLYRTYLHFIGYFIGQSFFKATSFYSWVRILTILSSSLLGIYIVVNKKLYKNKVNFMLLILFIILMPLVVNIVDFVAYNTELSTLNIYQFVIPFILCIVLLEYSTLNGKNFKKIIGIIECVSVLTLTLVGWDNFITTNRYYMKVYSFCNYTYSFNTRLLARIEETPGFSYDMPVMIVGEEESEFYEMLYDITPWNDVINYDQALWGRYVGYEDLYFFENDAKIIRIIGNTLGVDLQIASFDVKEKILETNEFENMEVWPSKDAVKIIDDVLVIKM